MDPVQAANVEAINRLGINAENLVNPPVGAEKLSSMFTVPGASTGSSSLSLGSAIFQQLGLVTPFARFVSVSSLVFIGREVIDPYSPEKADDRIARVSIPLVLGGIAAVFF